MYNEAIVVGTGKLAFGCAKMLIEKGINCAVFEYGKYSYSQLSVLCNNEKIKYHSVDKFEITEYLVNMKKPTLVISANNIYIFPKDVVNNDNLFIINFHPALLPKHPGRNAEAWSIYEGDVLTGITWHLVDEKIDHGKMIYQSSIPVEETTTSLQLMTRQFVVAANGFKEIVDNLINSNLTLMEYSKQDKITMHYSKDIPNGGELDTKWSIDQISRFLRAMDYGRLNVLGRPYLIWNESKYIWDKYKIIDNDLGEKTNLQEGIICNDKKVILLINLRKEV